jgi:hypothetical protein
MIHLRFETVSLSNVLAQRLNGSVVHFDHVITLATDQVMVSMHFQQLENPNTASKIGLRQKTGIAKSLERAIDGGAIQGRTHWSESLENLVSRQVILGLLQDGQNHQALRCGTLFGRTQHLDEIGGSCRYRKHHDPK